jgi:toxin ParE1/3/4
VTHKIVFAPEARDDLRRLYLFIAERAGASRAFAYVEKIENYCRSLEDFPERGMRHDHILTGLRIVGFEHRVSIAFQVSANTVTFYRIAYGGRDFASLMTSGD